MLTAFLLACLMISLVAKNIDGCCPLTLTIQDTLLLPPVDAIARHFGAGGEIKLHCIDVDKYLRKTKDGKYFVCPDTSTIEKCYPSGRNITLDCTAEWDDSIIPHIECTTEGATANVHHMWGHPLHMTILQCRRTASCCVLAYTHWIVQTRKTIVSA